MIKASQILGCWLVMGGVAIMGETPSKEYPVSRYIQYGFTIKNDTGQMLDRAELWAYAPVKQTSHQQCLDVRSSHEFEVIEDELGNQILHFTFDNFEPFNTRIVRIDADLVLTDEAQPCAPPASRYLAPEPFVEIDHPEFNRLAPTFEPKEESLTIAEVFRWVNRNVKDEGYVRDDRGALYALRQRRGDCSEHMFLFTALCRSLAIPARGVEGYICRQNTKLHPSAYHSWAEVYHGGFWQVADPLKGVFEENPSQYVAMRIVGGEGSPMEGLHRFRFEGKGLKVSMLP